MQIQLPKTNSSFSVFLSKLSMSMSGLNNSRTRHIAVLFFPSVFNLSKVPYFHTQDFFLLYFSLSRKGLQVNIKSFPMEKSAFEIETCIFFSRNLLNIFPLMPSC